ncbi:unnamed protein product, partial [marine sediment metagenome]
MMRPGLYDHRPSTKQPPDDEVRPGLCYGSPDCESEAEYGTDFCHDHGFAREQPLDAREIMCSRHADSCHDEHPDPTSGALCCLAPGHTGEHFNAHGGETWDATTQPPNEGPQRVAPGGTGLLCVEPGCPRLGTNEKGTCLW